MEIATPYGLVGEHGGTEDEVIAALLHDAVEDQGGENELERIRSRLGDDVANIVHACSDTFEKPKPDWRVRKERYIAHIAEASPSTLLVSAADKLLNVRSIHREIRSGIASMQVATSSSRTTKPSRMHSTIWLQALGVEGTPLTVLVEAFRRVVGVTEATGES